MKISFLGGADEVGASALLIEIGGKRLLVDCGIRMSARAQSSVQSDQLPDLSHIETGSGSLDAVLVTHAHTDHTGALELVVERFPEVPVYATAPTLALTRVLHQDARLIMQRRLDEESELPLFDDLAVQRLMNAFVPVPLKSRFSIADGLTATFFPAGHIAGAAMIGLESAEGSLLISGDFSISPQRTVDGARPPAFRPDALIIESTYGGRLHANRAVQERKLVETIQQTVQAGGKVLIPAFALGRAQEILLILDEYQRRGDLPAVPIWADGMVRAICQAYTSFGEALPLALQERGGQFFNSRIRPVATQEERNALLWNPGPAVIVASSGMLAGGPSLRYARSLAGKPENAILLTGYQDEESPGRRLQEIGEQGSGTLHLGPDRVDVQCKIASYLLSAHADEGQIIAFTETMDPDTVFLVHGDARARASLEKALSARQHSLRLPCAGQTFELSFSKDNRLFHTEAPSNLKARQAELNRQRQEKIRAMTAALGKWLIHVDNPGAPVLCLSLEQDHLLVETAPGLEQAVYPEAVLAVLGENPPTPAELAPFLSAAGRKVAMESNQALAAANKHFPPEARLRKSGYSLADQVITLTFDFPDAASEQYAELIASLGLLTGWQIRVNPETNHAALNSLAREVLPEGWQMVKGPAIHREQKTVSISVQVPSGAALPAMEEWETAQKFFRVSGWRLSALPAAAAQPAPAASIPLPGSGRMEINAAYQFIKAALEGTTLYRTSLKEDVIILSFISRQVGERYQEKLAHLSSQCGWPLSINPQPNQGAILELARLLLNQAGLAISKGPSIFLDKNEIGVTLSAAPTPEQERILQEKFENETGFRIILNAPRPAAASPAVPPTETARPIVEIPLRRIRLNRGQESIVLDPDKLEKAVERARRQGITPPIQVRRLQDGYVLVDGLYRLRAAEKLGLVTIPATIA
ncbi:MAG TPA: MBL fold metallo-hydrolase [Anaerolineaceae bacterium]|nr:MBL fold metallo-hydrolase [Anaerolineaceae bacterium]HPN53505.1 MBL fold metallo-hydrolase [Anaerolineaceae bacterium]